MNQKLLFSITLSLALTLLSGCNSFNPINPDDGGNPSSNSGMENGHEWVDLGLPSGLKWATCNIGASSPEEYGDYFAWGETSSKGSYTWSNLKYCKDTIGDKFDKYVSNSRFGAIDKLTVLDDSDDVARVRWKGNWRMPTLEEVTELTEHCTWSWITKNGVTGALIESNKNGNFIFIPAAGRKRQSSIWYEQTDGIIWSSSLDADLSSMAFYAKFGLYLGSISVSVYSAFRYMGHPIRPVVE